MKKEDIVIVELQKRQDIEDLGSAATIEGLELNSIPKYVELIEKLGGKFKTKPGEKLNVYVTSGAQMNKSFRLKGSNAYPDDTHIVSVDFARMAEAAGASFLTLHPRTRMQQYSGSADWKEIEAVKAAVAATAVDRRARALTAASVAKAVMAAMAAKSPTIRKRTTPLWLLVMHPSAASSPRSSRRPLMTRMQCL